VTRFRGRPAKKAPVRRSKEETQAERHAVLVRGRAKGSEVARITRSMSGTERVLIVEAKRKGRNSLPLVVDFFVSVIRDPRAPMSMRMKAAENLGDRFGLPRRTEHDVDSVHVEAEMNFNQIRDMILRVREETGSTAAELDQALAVIAPDEEDRFRKLVAPVVVPECATAEEEHGLVLTYLKSLLTLDAEATEEDVRLAIIKAQADGDLRAERMHEMFLAVQNRLYRDEMEDDLTDTV
jgi:hypothetical protein